MWCRRGIRREATEGSGWGDGRMRVSRRGRGGRGRSRARSNGKMPYLCVCGLHGGAGGATTEVGGENCAAGGAAGRAQGGWSAERCKARLGRAGMIKGAFGRRWAVDVRMQREQARTVRSSKR